MIGALILAAVIFLIWAWYEHIQEEFRHISMSEYRQGLLDLNLGTKLKEHQIEGQKLKANMPKDDHGKTTY
jgi:hypothetical protein